MTTVRVEGLMELAADLTKAQSQTLPEIAKIVGKGSGNIKQAWRRRWQGLAHAPALPYAIGYDVFYTFGAVRGEVGPDKNRRQGALGNLIEFGSVNNAPIPGGAPSLAEEAPKFERALDALGAKLAGGS